MEKVLNILGQLGIDKTIFYQFAIIVVAYYVTRILFLDRLKQVIVNREENTTKLLEQADKYIVSSEELSQKYNNKINETYDEAHAVKDNRYQKIKSELNEKFQEEEEKQNDIFTQEVAKLESKYEEGKVNLYKQKEEFVDLLVDKVKSGVAS